MTHQFSDMLSFGRPSKEHVARFWDRARRDRLSYGEVGATLREPPAGYNVDHNRVLLGHGAGVYKAAKTALFDWHMFALSWVDLLHPPEPPQPEQTVLILARVFSMTFLSASRIIALVDEEEGKVRRAGFVYGTLHRHAERGEERFTVEYRQSDDSVWYDLLAFSVPQHPLARLAFPLSRRAQHRFVRDSKQAMVRAVQQALAMPAHAGEI